MAGIVTAMDAGAMAVSLAECKAYLRIERDDEDALLAGFIRTATALCEAFTGQWLIVRGGEQRLAGDSGWQRISVFPVTAVLGVSGAGGAVAADLYESDVDAAGSGWVRLLAPAAVTTPVVRFRAGLGTDWNAVAEPLRQGIVRLVAHLFTHRDAADAGPPPAAVAAMWQGWRRVRVI